MQRQPGACPVPVLPSPEAVRRIGLLSPRLLVQRMSAVETTYLGFPVTVTETGFTVRLGGYPVSARSMKQVRLIVKGWRKESKEAA